MPCGCFGKKKKDVGEELEKKAPPTNSTDLKKAKAGGASSVEEDAGKTAKRRDVVASYYEDECALLGYRARPPSSYVDSPTSNDSHTTHTPSTVPVVASSTASQTSSASSPSTSPSTSRAAASSRAELAEKRREFFKDFYPNGESRRSGAVSYGDDERNLPSTLPTVARARQFGKVRPMRPVSQPTTPTDSPSAVPEAPPPPGPHLLHPVAKNGSSPRMGAKEDEEEEGGGFASPEFLRELKNASTEISQRWGAATIMVSEGEEEATTPSGLKMRPVKMMQRSSADDENVAIVVNDDENVTTTNDSQDGSCHSYSLVESGSELGTASLDPTHNTVNVPETLVTPPSPPSLEISEHFESPLPRSNAQPSDPGDIPSSSSSGKESPTALEAETVVPDSNAEFELISPDAAPVDLIVSDRVAAADAAYEDNFEFDSRLVATTEEDHERALEEDIKKMSCLRGDDDDSFDLSDEPPAWGETVVVEDVSRSRLESACSSSSSHGDGLGVGASLSSPEGEGQKNDGVPHEQYSTTNIINSSISEDIKTPN